LSIADPCSNTLVTGHTHRHTCMQAAVLTRLALKKNRLQDLLVANDQVIQLS